MLILSDFHSKKEQLKHKTKTYTTHYILITKHYHETIRELLIKLKRKMKKEKVLNCYNIYQIDVDLMVLWTKNIKSTTN